MATADPNSDNFTTVAKVGDIPAGEGRSFQLGDRLVAVFLHGDEYFAIDDLCPHMGASLGAGHLDEEGIVYCPWHAWRFRVCDGTWCDNPRIKTDDLVTLADPEGLFLASNVVPVSSGSGTPLSPADTHATPKGRIRSAISTSLPLLWVVAR